MDLTKLIASTCPVPHRIDGEDSIQDGLLINIPKKCKMMCKFKCINNPNLFMENTITICDQNYNLKSLVLSDDARIYLFGFILKGYKKIPRKTKKALNDFMIDESKMAKWEKSVQYLDKMIFALITKIVKESLNPLHDVKTAISLIFRNAEELIMEENGNTIDEKVENTDPRKKALFKSVSLLEERIRLMDLISNPNAASHGQKRKTSVYKLIDKLIKIHYSIANQKRVKIILNGKSHNSLYLYDSFSTVPLVLLDNAIKYSRENQDVIVNINDRKGNTIIVSIESYSPRIKSEMKERIFDKNTRGGLANNVTRQGSGIGLYLAKIVAKANDFQIQHKDNGCYNVINGIEYTQNIFSFEIREKF